MATRETIHPRQNDETNVSPGPLEWIGEGDGYYHAHQKGESCKTDMHAVSLLILEDQTWIEIHRLPKLGESDATRLAQLLNDTARTWVKENVKR